MDDSSCHGWTETLRTLQYVDVLFFPARTTSRIQPLDTGIIANVRRKYRRRQLERAIELIEEVITQNIYMTNLYMVMTIEHEIWTNTDEDAISNCSTKTELPTAQSTSKSERERQASTNITPNNEFDSDVEI